MEENESLHRSKLTVLDRANPLPAGVRTRDVFYLFIFLVLLMAYLMRDDVSDQVIEERKEEIKYQPAMTHPLDWTATVTQLGKTRLYVPTQRERNF